jgi:hypothetical protein
MKNLHRFPVAAGLFIVLATPVVAQTTNHPGNVNITGQLYVTDDSILDDNVCMGNHCDPSEAFDADQTLRLKFITNTIQVVDTSVSPSPDRDWSLRFNDNNPGEYERFAVEDNTAMTTPFSIQGGAPNNSLWVSSSGYIGIGTLLPQATLHIASTITPTLRFQGSGVDPQTWQLSGNNPFRIRNLTYGTSPFRIDGAAPSNALVLKASGNVGMGTPAPEEVLHIRTTAASTDAFALFDAAGAGSDAAFLLRQQGSVPSTWEFRNQQSSGRLNVGIAGGNTPLKIDNAAANNLLKLGINSNPNAVVVTGQLLVNNTQLNVPDYVFAHDYNLRPLAEVAAFIGTNSHLPDVPSEADIRANGVDMVQMQMILLKKVEELTLYALKQDARAAAQDAEVTTLRAQLSEMDVLRAQITRIEAKLE